MYYWVLVMSFVLNGETHTLEAGPLDWLMCKIVAGSAETKQIIVDGNPIQITEVHCEKRFKEK